MNDPGATRQSLLIRLADRKDGQAWFDFVDVYSPLIYGFARRCGLQDADAADLVQEVLQSVTRSVDKYSPEKGRFRSWLMTIVRRRLSEFRERVGRAVPGTGDTGVLRNLEQISAGEDEPFWEQEYRRNVFRVAATRIRDKFEDSTWQAFWLTTFEARKGKDVAQLLGISEGAVYIARSRVIARLKKQIQSLEE